MRNSFLAGLLAALVAALSWPAHAQQTITFNPVVYTGPADLETSMSLYWGFSAATGALASAHVVAADLSDNTNTCTGVKISSNGYLDVSSGTTYCTGGVTVSALCAADGAGACAYGGIMHVTKLYQQIGSTSAPFTAAYATAPYFILNGWGGQPIWACQSSVSQQMLATITSVPLPYTLGVSFAQIANFTGAGTYFAGVNYNILLNGQAVNTVEVSASAGVPFLTKAATNATGTSDFTLSHAHRLAFSVTAAGTTQALYLDGAPPVTATITGASAFGTGIAICSFQQGSEYADAFMNSVYIDPVDAATSASSAVEAATGLSLP